MKRENINSQIMNYVLSSKSFTSNQKGEFCLKYYSKDEDALDSPFTSFISQIHEDKAAMSDFIGKVVSQNYTSAIKDWILKHKYQKDYFKDYPEVYDETIKEQVKPNEEKVSELIQNLSLHRNDDGVVVDKDGKEYVTENYSFSPFGALTKLVPCIDVNGTTIRVDTVPLLKEAGKAV
jgi:hypothetical protein